jgi:hypothetical protein
MTKSVLFILNGINHARTFKPVIAELASRSGVNVKVIFFFDRKSFPDMNGDYPLIDWLQEGLDKNYIPLREKYNNLPYYKRLGIIRSIRKQAKKLMSLASGPVTLVVGSDFGYIEKIYMGEVHRSSGRVVLYQDGFLTRFSPHFDLMGDYSISNLAKVTLRNFLSQVTRWLGHNYLVVSKYGKGGADTVVVWGEHFRRVLLDRGIVPARIRTTGRLGIHTIIPWIELRHHILQAEDGIVVTYFTTKYIKDKENISQMQDIQELIQLVRAILPAASIILKIHPTLETVAEYAHFKDRYERLIICQKEVAMSVAAMSEVVFGGLSTTIFESMAVNPHSYMLLLNTPPNLSRFILKDIPAEMPVLQSVDAICNVLDQFRNGRPPKTPRRDSVLADLFCLPKNQSDVVQEVTSIVLNA